MTIATPPTVKPMIKPRLLFPPSLGSTGVVPSAKTVTMMSSVFPLLEVTVIRVLPSFKAVTSPVALTLATVGSLLSQVKVLSSASVGAIVAVNWTFSPTFNSWSPSLMVTLVTLTA